MQNDPNSERWRRSLAGDKLALAELFTECYSTLYNYGIRLVQDRGRVEDAIQNVFVTLWQRRNRIGQAHSVTAYLLSTLRRSLLKPRRGRRFFSRSDWKQVEESTPDLCFLADQLIVEEETEALTREVVADLLNQLTPQQREVLYLKYFMGLSYRETAAIVALEYQSVVNLHHRALRSLRRNLEGRPALARYLKALRAS